jgi:hypothetical protein
MKRTVKNLVVIAGISAYVVLVGCASGFEKYYAPMPGAETVAKNPRFERPPAVPVVFAHSAALTAAAAQLEEQGYILIGTSSFYGPASKVTKSQAVTQGEKIGAALILIKSQYMDTVTQTIPVTVPNAPRVSTVNTAGTVSTYGNGGYATGNYNSTSTITSPGGSSTYSFPYSVSRNTFFASYWVKQDVLRMRLGVNAVVIPEAMRAQLRRNTGVYALSVVRGTPAFNANVMRGDVIVKFNGEDVIDPAGYGGLLTKYAGQTVTLGLMRDGNPIELTVTLRLNSPAP